MTETKTDPRADRSKAKALESARFLLVSEGWDAVTHLRVAEHSGLGRATIYRHWPHTVDLLKEVLGGEVLTISVASTDDVRADLVSTLKMVRRELIDRGFGRVFATLIDRAEWDMEMLKIKKEIVDQGTQMIRNRIELAIARRQIGGSVNSQRAVSQLLGPVLYRRYVSGEALTTRFLESIVRDFLAGPI